MKINTVHIATPNLVQTLVIHFQGFTMVTIWFNEISRNTSENRLVWSVAPGGENQETNKHRQKPMATLGFLLLALASLINANTWIERSYISLFLTWLTFSWYMRYLELPKCWWLGSIKMFCPKYLWNWKLSITCKNLISTHSNWW